jgi:hypothetical protein
VTQDHHHSRQYSLRTNVNDLYHAVQLLQGIHRWQEERGRPQKRILLDLVDRKRIKSGMNWKVRMARHLRREEGDGE